MMGKGKLVNVCLSALLLLLTVAASMGGFGTAGTAHATSTKLTLTTSMVTLESGGGDPTALVDEQATAGDPLNNAGGSPTIGWEPGFQAGATPAFAYIDLGQMYNVTDIYLYDANGINNYNVYTGSPGSWTLLFTDPLASFNHWNRHTVNIQTRYLEFSPTNGGAHMYEVVIYGSPVAGDVTAPAAITNLTVGTPTAGSLKLNWTAPGDDGATGTASSYDIRYSTSPITSTNWGAATQVTGEPAPASAGTAQSITITGLAPSTTYYFAMTTSDEVPNASALSNVASGTTGAVAVQKITLTPDMITDEIAHTTAGQYGATSLVDEQTIVGDPLNGVAGTAPATSWYLFGNNYPSPHNTESWWIPASEYIDLGATYHISSIYYYDASGSSSTVPMVVAAGTPASWTTLFTADLVPFNKWMGQTVNVDTRYVRFTFNNAGGHVNEAVLYGYPLTSPEPAPTPVVPTQPTMDQFMGINALNDDSNDPGNSMSVVNVVREYNDWSWGGGGSTAPAYPSNQTKWNPSYAGTPWNFDAFYSSMKTSGKTVIPVVQQVAGWLVSGDYNTPKTVPTGMSSTDPASYAAHADHMYQFAARYGSTAVPNANLKLASDQTHSTGLNTLSYLENWNEPNPTFGLKKGNFLPYEFAAMLSADYDGDEGRLGSTFGVKNADPNMKLVMGGLINFSVDYVKAIKSWADWNRSDKKFPADVLNFHTYCNNGSVHQGGISPEACGLKDAAKKLTDYRNLYLPGKEVWVSEFGYDIQPDSPQAVPTIGTNTAQETQGQWLVRSYLALAAGGVDRAMMYMLRDVDPTNGQTYKSSGLVGPNGDWTKKTSWYYVNTTRLALTGTRYLAEQTSGNANVMIYKFKNASNNGGVYAIWSPTSNNTQVAGYQLTLPATATTATQIAMVDGDDDGVSTALTISGGKVTVNVSERPIFIKVNNIQ